MSDDKSSWLKDALGFVVDKVEDAAGVASSVAQTESDTLGAGVAVRWRRQRDRRDGDAHAAGYDGLESGGRC